MSCTCWRWPTSARARLNEARNALRKIQQPDANVILQMGLLSLQEKQLAQAEGEFARAWQMDPQSYEICYNLLLTRLTLGKVEDCLALIPDGAGAGAARAASDARRRTPFLAGLAGAVAGRAARATTVLRPRSLLAELTTADEQRLLKVVRSLGQLDTVHTLLKALTEARPRSARGARSVSRGRARQGQGADRSLRLDRGGIAAAAAGTREERQPGHPGRPAQPARLLRLHDAGFRQRHHATSPPPSSSRPTTPRLHQNLALTYELKGDLPQADPHWNRYFDLLDDQRARPRRTFPTTSTTWPTRA